MIWDKQGDIKESDDKMVNMGTKEKEDKEENEGKERKGMNDDTV